ALKSVVIKNLNSLQEYATTDENGNFSFHTGNLINTLIAYAPNEYTELCMSARQVTIDTVSKSAYVEFLVKSIDDCPHLRVEITQPDLVKCNNSKYQVYVKNIGATVSEP